LNSTILVICNQQYSLQCDELIKLLANLSLLTIYTRSGLLLQQAYSSLSQFKPNLFIYLQYPGPNLHFLSLKGLSQHKLWEASSPVLVVQNDKGETAALKAIAPVWRATRAPKIGVLQADGSLYEWNPHGPDNCRQVHSLIATNTDKLFKKQHGNMTGCTLNAATYMILPFVGYPREKTSKNRGLEVDIAYTLAEQHGMTLEFVKRPYYEVNETSWTIRLQNGSAGGAMALLNNHQADLAFNSLALSIARWEIGDPIFPHTMDEVTWFVPVPPVKKVFFNFRRSFTPYGWYNICLILIFTMVGYYIAEPKCTFCDAFFRTINVLLGGAVKNLKHAASNQLTLYLYLCALHLLVAYQIGLIKHLVKPEREARILSLEDGVQRGMHFLLIASMMDHYTEENDGWEFFQDHSRWTMSQNPPADLAFVANSTNKMALQPKYTAIYFIRYVHTHRKIHLFCGEISPISPFLRYISLNHRRKSVRISVNKHDEDHTKASSAHVKMQKYYLTYNCPMLK